jgi:hypothetical protein
MIKRVLAKRDLADGDAAKRDLAYWLSRPPEERIAAVEDLRRQHHGDSARLQRVVRVIDQSEDHPSSP